MQSTETAATVSTARTNYIFDNAAEDETAQRFGSLDTIYNPRTFAFLEAAGIAPGCKCLEVGGGSGGVAAWMAERVGPQGSVLVTDIEPRFIERSPCGTFPNVELRRHDIGVDPLPEAAFDLVHARLVLLHVPQRHLALEKIIRSLKPGGRLVIEEFDARLVDRTTPLPDDPRAKAFKRVIDALFRLMVERGFDVDWPRGLYRRFKAAGLIEVGMEGHMAVREGASAGAALDAANLTQIRKEAVIRGLVTNAEIDAALAALGATDFAMFSPILFTAWGRLPM
jgi:ubiquinone/menaquinone biosynthesis C-methylase UbiE